MNPNAEKFNEYRAWIKTLPVAEVCGTYSENGGRWTEPMYAITGWYGGRFVTIVGDDVAANYDCIAAFKGEPRAFRFIPSKP